MSNAALAWLLQQPQVQCCIVGASSPTQIENNCSALKIPKVKTYISPSTLRSHYFIYHQETVDRLGSFTDELKTLFGQNADPWAAVSRMV
jgi:hypothetical protein